MKPAIVVEWDPPEAANPDFFYNLHPWDKRQAKILVKSKFSGGLVPRLRVTTPLPIWLKVSPESFTPPATLIVEVDATKVQAGSQKPWTDQFELEIVLDE